jgi:hypothetical protein
VPVVYANACMCLGYPFLGYFFLIVSCPSFIPTFGILFILLPLKDVKHKTILKLLMGQVKDPLRLATQNLLLT